MRIKLRSISLKDFKGVEKANFEFQSRESFIHGDNGTGKTTLYDAFLWCMFGKDHEDRSDYRIKPIKSDGTYKNKPECEVSLLLDVDNKPLELQRIYKEKWTKPKTEPEPVYDGDTTIFYINGISVSMTEYNAKIKELFPDVNLFKSITNVRYFTSFKKEEQRKLLFGMVPEITDEEIASGNNLFLEVLKEVSGVSFEAYKKDLNAKKSKIKDEVKGLPDRIEGLKLSKPEEKDWNEISKQINILSDKIGQIDRELLDASENVKNIGDERIRIQNEINKHRENCNKIQQSERSEKLEKINAEQQKIKLLNIEIDNIDSERISAEQFTQKKAERIETLNGLIAQKESLLKSLREEWVSINSSQVSFPDGAFICPTCKRSLEVSDIDEKQKELTDNFNKEKSEKLEANKQKGLRVKADIEDLKKELDTANVESKSEALFSGTKISIKKDEIEAIRKKIEQIESEPDKYTSNAEFVHSTKEIERLSGILEQTSNQQSNESILSNKKELTESLDRLKSELALKSVIENTDMLIEQHEKSFKTLNQELSELEKKEYALKQFEFAKIDAYESKVNSLFKIVKFKLFDTQKDGQIVPDCEATVNGVPFGTLNNAKQVSAGLDIIEAISRSKDMYAPIFIDNREGVVEIPEIETQVINLVVEAGAKLHLK